MANTTKTVTVKINLDTLSAEDSAKVLKLHIKQLEDEVSKQVRQQSVQLKVPTQGLKLIIIVLLLFKRRLQNKENCKPH